jgi:hypothetical protein
MMRSAALGVIRTIVVLTICLPAHAGTRGADELFWVPTLEQALEMSAATGRPIFLMPYTCVDKSAATYTGQTTVW